MKAKIPRHKSGRKSEAKIIKDDDAVFIFFEVLTFWNSPNGDIP